jgi:hypothetical protein
MMIDWHWMKQRMEIEARWHKLKVVYGDLEGAGYILRWPEGMKSKNEHGEILVKKRQPLNEQVITIGHELGHWVLHHLKGVGNNSPEAEAACESYAWKLVWKWHWQRKITEWVNSPAASVVVAAAAAAAGGSSENSTPHPTKHRAW